MDTTMTTFDQREQAFEALFVHDETMKFSAYARRNRLLGLWAAEALGKQGDDAQAYAKAVLLADFEEAGDEDVFRKVRRDFDQKGVAVSEIELRTKMAELLALAVAQLRDE
jgi:hypothetical protein